MKKKVYLLITLLLVSFGISFSQSLSFEIRNEQQKGKTYSFDVFMKADQNGTFHSRGQVYLSYNPQAFGEAIATQGKVQVTPAALLTEQSVLGAKYQTINVTDNDNNLVLTWQSNFLGVAPSRNTHTFVPTTYMQVYHVEMELKDATQAAQLSFHGPLMQGQQFMLVGANQEVQYGQSNFQGLKWLTFTASFANVHDVKLTWKTNSFSSDYYVIEKKKNEGVFEELSRVKAESNPQRLPTYTYLDESGMGNQNYYRIKQVDVDGSVHYSEIVMLEMEAVKSQFMVFPSPASSEITLQAHSPRLAPGYTFNISDVNGKVVYSGKMKENGQHRTTVDVSGYAAGTYYVQTSSPEGKVYLNKFVKVNR